MRLPGFLVLNGPDVLDALRKAEVRPVERRGTVLLKDRLRAIEEDRVARTHDFGGGGGGL